MTFQRIRANLNLFNNSSYRKRQISKYEHIPYPLLLTGDFGAQGKITYTHL